MMIKRLGGAVSLALIILSNGWTPSSSSAASVQDFYKGKTVKIVIGSRPGGSYGLYALLTSRHLGKFVPGSPTVIMESRPGAGGLVALNYLGTVAPRDGTVMTVAQVTIVQEGMFNKRAKYDPSKFRFIGRLGGLQILLMASKQSGIKSLEDARNRDVAVGAAGSFNFTAQLPQTLNRLTGTRFKVTAGYQGTGESFLALERGEVDVAATSLDTLRARHWSKVTSGKLVPIAVYARERLAGFPMVPTVGEFGRTDIDKAFLKIFTVGTEIGRSLAFPPGVPEARLAAVRAAYEKMIVDPAFQADAKKVKLKLMPASGEKLDRIVSDTLNIPSGTIAKARVFYNGLRKGIVKKKRKKKKKK